MLKLIFELIIIVLVVFGVLWMIDQQLALGIFHAVTGTKSNITTSTITIPYAKLSQVLYVNKTLQTTSYSIINDTLLYVKGGNNRITVIVKQTPTVIPVLYVNMTGSDDSLLIKSGFVVLNIWGTADSITLYNSTLLSANLHGNNGDYIYNETASGNHTIYNAT